MIMLLNEFEEVFDKVYPNQINLKSFLTKSNLNEKFWIDGKLNNEVRIKLLSIANDFMEFLDLGNIKPVDIIFVGSLASYNWSKYSDIDLHLVLDFKEINKDTKLVDNYVWAMKNEWNNEHEELKIFGYEVELFVQDINADAESNGIYSIKNDYWLKFPKSISKKLDKEFIKTMSSKIINKIDKYEMLYAALTLDTSFKLLLNRVEYLYSHITEGRRESLSQEGEFGAGNIVFKVLRRTGHLGKLKKLKTNIQDKINSIK